MLLIKLQSNYTSLSPLFPLLSFAKYFDLIESFLLKYFNTVFYSIALPPHYLKTIDPNIITNIEHHNGAAELDRKWVEEPD